MVLAVPGSTEEPHTSLCPMQLLLILPSPVLQRAEIQQNTEPNYALRGNGEH